jgi:hypothetical protein
MAAFAAAGSGAICFLTVGFAFALLHIGANSLKAQGDCKVVLEAANKTVTTATHTYSTMNIAGKDQTVESTTDINE